MASAYAGGDLARTYAKVVGVGLLLLGIIGLIAGDPEDGLLGILNIDITEDLVHILSGGVLAYVGFKGTDAAVKSTVTAVGVVYLLVGLLGFVDKQLFGLIPHEYTVVDNIIHLGAGAVALFAGLKGGTSARTTA